MKAVSQHSCHHTQRLREWRLTGVEVVTDNLSERSILLGLSKTATKISLAERSRHWSKADLKSERRAINVSSATSNIPWRPV